MHQQGGCGFLIFLLSLKKMISILYCLTFVVAILSNCNSQDEDLLPCEDQQLGNTLPPQLPRVFRAELELVNFVDLDSDPVYVTLNYDGESEGESEGEGGRLAISYIVSGNTRHIVLDYGQKLVIQYSAANDECSVGSMETDTGIGQELHVLFPLLNLNLTKGQMFEPESLFGIVPTVLEGYFGKDSCRAEDRFAQQDGAIDCEKWAFCQTRGGTDVVDNVLVYWTVLDWSVPGSEKPVFLGYEVQTRNELVNTTIDRKSVNVMYMSDDLDQSAFEIPEGVVCDMKGVKSESQPIFPRMDKSGVWEFQTEAVFNDRRKVINTHTWFDFPDGLGRISYTKDDDVRITSIADWNRDFVFVISGDKCETRKLLTGEDVFAEIGAQELPILQFGSHAMMFGVDDPSNWKYIGKRYVRNILTHVWQRVRRDWPNSQYSTNSLWDWHFASSPDNSRMIPAYLRIRVLSVATEVPAYVMNSVIEYHIYGFGYARNSDQYDAGECFSSAEKQHLQFQLEVAKNETLIPSAEIDLLWRLKIIIAATAQVSPLRITETRIVAEGKKVFVQFYLLGKPRSIDSTEPSLENAKENLNQFIERNTFFIPFNEMHLHAVADTLSDVRKECVRSQSRVRRSAATNDISREAHTSDDVLGVCLGSLLSGLAVGASTTLLIAVKKSNVQ